MVSHAPPEHDADSAYCSDHIVDANKMVPAGLPSEKQIEAEIRPMSYEGADLTECVSRILDLIRPAFEAKELHHVTGERITRKDLNNAYREGSEKGRLAAHLIDGVNSPLNACCYRDGCRDMQATLADCAMYLKDGETPRQRMDRDFKDTQALTHLLAEARAERDAAEAKLAQAVEDEREACAQIAMMVADNGIVTSAAIRARSAAAMGEKR